MSLTVEDSVRPAGDQPAERRWIDEPGRSDRFVTGVAELVGGAVGDHAVKRGASGLSWTGRFLTAARAVLLLACLTLAANWVQKAPCGDGNWQHLSQYKHFCYSDVLALYYSEELNVGKVPYFEHKVEYPVLTGAFMGLVGLPTHALGQTNPDINQAQWYTNATTFILAVLGVASVVLMLRMRQRRPWDIAMFAVAPVLLLTAGINWDLLSIFFAMYGLYLWGRQRPELAGVMLGLGTAAKLWPAFILIALIMLAFRTAKWRETIIAGITAVGTWLLVNLPVYLGARDGWLRFFQLNDSRGIDWGTFWYIGAHFPRRGTGRYGFEPFIWLGVHVHSLNRLSYLLFALSVAGIGWLAVRAPRRPRVAQLAFLVVAAFLIFSKVWSQQYVLWLLPLAVLARPRWTAFLVWQFFEVCYFFAFYGELMNASGRYVFPEGVFVFASLLRMAGVLVMVAFIVRDILQPERDAVRRSYDWADPDGGAFEPVPVQPERAVRPAPAVAGGPLPFTVA